MQDKRYPPTPRIEEECCYSPMTPVSESPRCPNSPTLPDGLPKKESVAEMLEGSPQTHIPLGQFPQVEFIHLQTPEQIDQQLQRELEQAQACELEEGALLEADEGKDETLEDEIIEAGPILDQYQPQPIHDLGGLSSQIEDFIHQVTAALAGSLNEHTDPPNRNIHRENHHHRLRARRHQRRPMQHQAPASEIHTNLLSNATPSSRTQTNIIHPDFHPTLDRLSRPLYPLISVTTGLPHPSFPKSILAYNLLTSRELNDLAIHFHQVYPPTRETFRYPLPVKPWVTTNGFVRDLGVDIEVKRRRFGRFIGMKGCESPTELTMRMGGSIDLQAEIRASVEREWERAREVARWEQERRYFELEMERERGRARVRRMDSDLERETEGRRPRGMYYL